jgi:hypothetical protein
VCPAALAAATGASEHPDFDRTADGRPVAAPVPEAAGFCVSKQPNLLAALLSEGIEALAA